MLFPALLLNTLHQLVYHQGFMPCPLSQFVPLTNPPQSLFPNSHCPIDRWDSSSSRQELGSPSFRQVNRERSILSTNLNMVLKYGLASNFEQRNETMYLKLSNRFSNPDPKRDPRLKFTFNPVMYRSWSSLPGRRPSWGGRLRGPSSHALCSSANKMVLMALMSSLARAISGGYTARWCATKALAQG